MATAEQIRAELAKREFRANLPGLLHPYGYMPEGLPRILPPFGEFEQFKIADQWSYIDPTGILVQVRADTLTDLASVPFPFRSLLAIPGRESAGAVAHDSGYRHPLRPRWNVLQQRYELLKKDDWDRIFDTINKMAGVSATKRGCLNFGLDVGGWIGWKSGLKHDKSTLPYPILPCNGFPCISC